MRYWGKGTVFYFFRGKVCAHSLTQIWEHLYFFFPKRGKKKYSCIFFFPGKVHVPLTQLFWRSLYKKIGGKQYFFRIAIFNPILRCIFFFPRSVFFFLVFFFFLEKFKPHSLTHFKRLYFFISGVGKEKIQCFYSLTRFCQNCHKN